MTALITTLSALPEAWVLTPVNGKKAPYINDWQRISVTREMIAQDIRNGKAQGFGIITGKLSGGIMAIDCDGHVPHALFKEILGGDIPLTVAFTSGKEGRAQYLFSIPEDYWDNINTKKAGTAKDGGMLEFRWDGGQSVLPPSVHPETGRYDWINSPDTTAIATLPNTVLGYLLKPKHHPEPLPHEPKPKPVFTSGYIPPIPIERCLTKEHRAALENGVSEGNRDNMGCSLARDLIGVANYAPSLQFDYCGHYYQLQIDGDPYDLLADYCRKCSPPLSQKDCDRIYKSAQSFSPAPSINDESLSNCLRSWVKKHQPVSKTSVFKRIEPESVKSDDYSNCEEEENSQFLQVKLGSLLEIKDKKAPHIFQGDLAKSLQTTAKNFGISLEILVFCLLPILSARIPSETRLLINPGTDYSVPALRWIALVGETGTKKSPVLKTLLAPLMSIQKQMAIAYKAEKDAYDKEYTLWKNKKGNESEKEPTPPAPMVDCYFSDFTIESIGQSISDRPQDSYLVFVDELAGFFNSMDAYRKGGGDRQKWLDLYNAGALKINRKGSPTIFCPHTSVSILGGLQPSVLAQMIKQDANAGDGLWNRFMFCSLSQTKTKAFSDNSISLFDCLFSLYTNLASAPPSEHILSDAAKPLWEAWHDEIEERVMNEPSDLLRGTYAKAEGIAGRNALIVHRAIAAQQGATPASEVSSDVMEKAIEWTQWELGQTLLEYQRLGLTDDPELSRILRFIDKFEGRGWVNARMVTHWWSPKPKPPANELRVFMAKVVSLGYATDNKNPSDSSDYQILIL
jgi:Protein of unknown function (DUF3987)/Bifunctional DNA primase/polymerase, N-terminal